MTSRVLVAVAAACVVAVVGVASLWRSGGGTSGTQWQLDYADDGSIRRIQAPDGTIVSYRQERDSAGRLLRVVKDVDGRQAASYTYDRFGRRTEMADRDDTVAYEYDGFSRVTAMRRGRLPAVLYSYDTLNRLTTQRVGSDWSIKYTYDFLGRVASIGTPIGNITFQHATGNGAIVRTLPNGVRTIREFSPNGSLDRIVHVSPEDTELASFSYVYRMDGLISEIRERVLGQERSNQYEYDHWRRLKKVTASDGDVVEYEYDRQGNRIAIKRGGAACCQAAYDRQGRLLDSHGAQTGYDARGNLRSHPDPAAKREFAFDSENSLVSARNSDREVRYRYDGERQLVTRTTGENSTDYVAAGVVDRWMPLAEVEDGRITVAYVWDDDVPVSAVRSGEAEFYLQDHLNSTRLIVDGNGRPKQVLHYDPFGIPQEPFESTSLIPGFAGMFYDPAQDLYLTRFRAYAPGLGRFLQPEPEPPYPLTTPEGSSLYGYSAGDPVNFVDRSGLQRTAVSAPPTPVLDEMRQWEQQNNQRVRQDQLQEFGNKVGAEQAAALDDLAEIAAAEWIREVVESNMRGEYSQMLGLKFYSLVNGSFTAFDAVDLAMGMFGRTSHELALKFRDARGRALARRIEAQYRQSRPLFADQAPRVHRVLRPDSSARFARTMAVGVVEGVTSTLGTIADPTEVALDYVDQIGRSMMLAHPTAHPLKLNLTQGIAEGHGSYAIPGGRVDFHEVVGMDTLAGPPSIKQWQWDHATTGFGTVDRRSASSTPTSNPFARLLSILYPLGSQFEPGQTTEVRSTQIRERYRVTTTGGNTVLTPLQDGTATPPDSDAFDGGDGGGGGGGGGDSGGGGGGGGDDGRGGGSGGGGGGGGGGGWGGGGGLRSGCCAPPSFRAPLERESEDPRELRRPPTSWPTPVGGVFLRGAGDALRSLGHISGIGFDPLTGQWILISQDGPLNLPPLRLDDVVAVFRTVYRYGPPYVSIDPDPASPTGPRMKVRHDEGTQATHAGWVLFEADRVMKSYSLGKDNVSLAAVSSGVPGYQNLLQLGFLQPGWGTDRSAWERFWIVPGNVVRETTKDSTFTFLRMALRVRTEPMVLVNGTLQSRPNARPSFAADRFSSWFTDSYAAIASEAVTAPPTGTAGESSLSELERIAVIAGAAEVLRDNGVPLPAWMMDFPVTPFPIPRETPSTINTSQDPTRAVTARIYGGVNLAADDSVVRKIAASEEQEDLAKKVLTATQSAPPLTPVSLTHAGRGYKALALPGNDTMADGANVVEAIDLAVRVTPRREITLTRRSSSFAAPADVFGRVWTLDLPRLYAQQVPLQRKGDVVTSRQVWQLTSPLNSYSGYFTSGLIAARDARIGTETRVVPAATPREQWHFDANGCLAGLLDPPVMIVYRVAADCRVHRIEGWLGSERKAQIDLQYDSSGHLASAESSDGGRATYEYDSGGELREVRSPAGIARYEYADGVLRAFTDDRGTERFSLDNRGRRSDVATAPASTRTAPDADAPVVTTTGRMTTVRLPEGGVWEVTRDDQGRILTVLQDGEEALRQTWRQDGLLEAGYYETFSLFPQYESDGTLTAVFIAAPDGTPSSADSVRPAVFAGDDRPLRAAWMQGASRTVLTEWLRIDVDRNEQLSRISDYTGHDMRLSYDAAGALTQIASPRGGVSIQRDQRGRPVSVDTSWGLSQRYEYNGDELGRVTIQKGDESTAIDYQNGNPSGIGSSDGSVFTFSSSRTDQGAGSFTVNGPDDVSMRHEFGADGRLESTQAVGLFTMRYVMTASGCLGGYGVGP